LPRCLRAAVDGLWFIAWEPRATEQSPIDSKRSFWFYLPITASCIPVLYCAFLGSSRASVLTSASSIAVLFSTLEQRIGKSGALTILSLLDPRYPLGFDPPAAPGQPISGRAAPPLPPANSGPALMRLPCFSARPSP